jgi:thiol-disulfide isomerase/thioredoxin
MSSPSLLSNARILLHPHYSINIFLSVFYVVLKQLIPTSLSSYVFTNKEITSQDTQVLLLLATIITIRGRKTLTWLHYIDSVCKYSKMANCLLFYREQSYVLLIFYAVLCLLHFLFFAPPEPTGKTNILYYRANNLDNEIRADPRLTWFVCFYAPWSPPCQNFASVFVDLSTRFGDLKTFRFVKFDVNRYQAEANKFKIDTSTFSKQLPTVVLFQDGKEVKRRPQIDVKGRVLDKQRLLTADYLIDEFGLAEIYTREANKIKTNPKKEQ